MAVKWGFIQKNPVKVVKQLKLDSRLQTYLEPHEIEKFLNVIDKKEYKFNYFNSSYWFSFLGAMKKLAQVGFKGLIMPIGAREAGTGNAVASVLMGANSIFQNPAAITEISGNKSFAFNYMNWLADIKHGAGAVVFGMENIGLSTCSKYFSHI